ncbi:MAG: tetratricopeptide repeat protein, partial [Chloroflexota bacterium]
MTELALDPAREQPSIQERVEILSKELELAIRWQSPCILFAVYSSEYVRADVEAMLENNLMDLGQVTTRIQARSGQPRSMFPLVEAHKPYNKRVFFVNDLSWGHSDNAGVFASLNARREFFSENGIRAVFWLTQKEIVDLSRKAPDFWAYRDCVVEFIEAPKAEQILVRELEAAWQGAGEYADPYEDTDDKILLRENLLTAIPQQDEAISIRANMLLTLGILNWRKGDFEKADEQLQKALKFAAQIQDNWFEAECLNAIALLRSSTGKHEDAIEAYKQAIHLAPDQIFAWNNLGNLCAKIGRNDEALVTFIKALECNPQDAVAWNGLGSVYRNIGYVDDAIAAYRRSIHFMPSFAHPWNGLGDAYASVGRNDEAVQAYQRAAKLNDRYVTPWLNLGALFNKQDRDRDALKAFRHAAMLDPRNGKIWNEIGLLHSKRRAFDDAVTAFAKAIEIDRADGWAYGNLGLACAQQGKFAESVPLLLRSVELLKDEKDKAVSWNRLGDVYRQLNEYDKAMEAYAAADKLEHRTPAPVDAITGNEPISSVPPRPMEIPSEVQAEEAVAPAPVTEIRAEVPIEANLSRLEEPETPEEKDEAAPGWIFASAGNDAASGQSADRAASTTGEEGNAQPMPDLAHTLQMAKTSTDKLAEAMAWNEKGNRYFKQGDYEAAISAYNQAIQLDPSLGWSYSNLAHIYVMKNQLAEAILLYQKSIDLLDTDKDKAICWNGLGNVYRRLNDYDNAVAAYQKAAELDPETSGMREGAGSGAGEQTPKNAGAWNALGDAFLKSGSYKEAVVAFKKAIRMNPNLALAYGNLALALTYLGK